MSFKHNCWLLLFAVAALFSQGALYAQSGTVTYTVTSTTDPVTPTAGTLRYAFQMAKDPANVNKEVIIKSTVGFITLQSSLSLADKDFVKLDGVKVLRSGTVETGISFTNCDKLVISKCEFWKFGLGLKISQSTDVEIDNCIFLDHAQFPNPTLTFANGLNCGIYASEIIDLTINWCTFSETFNAFCPPGGSTVPSQNGHTRGGIKLFKVNTGILTLNDIREIGRYNGSNDRIGIDAEECDNLTFQGNYLYGGITCTHADLLGTFTAFNFTGTRNCIVSSNVAGVESRSSDATGNYYNDIHYFIKFNNKPAVDMFSEQNKVYSNRMRTKRQHDVFYTDNCYGPKAIYNEIYSNIIYYTGQDNNEVSDFYGFSQPLCTNWQGLNPSTLYYDEVNRKIKGVIPAPNTGGRIYIERLVTSRALPGYTLGIVTSFTNRQWEFSYVPLCGDEAIRVNYIDELGKTHKLSQIIIIKGANNQEYFIDNTAPVYGAQYESLSAQSFVFQPKSISTNFPSYNNYKVTVQVARPKVTDKTPDWATMEEKVVVPVTNTPSATYTYAMSNFSMLANPGNGSFFWRAVIYDLNNSTQFYYSPVYRFDVAIPEAPFTLPVDNYISTLQSQPINWEYTVNYFDDGKTAESMTYTDGLDKVRQVQSKNQVENMVLAVETVYSEEGGGTIQTLPAPIGTDGKFGYAKDFFEGVNPVTSSVEDYNTRFFDRNQLNPGVSLPVTPTPAAVTSLVNKYYSNTALGYNDNVDNASNYPFNYTVNYQDPTGRIALSPAGFGPEFILTTRPNKHFYGVPTITELQRVFGTGTPISVNDVKRTSLYDPNGVASVTYTDNEGKTIATALQVCPAQAPGLTALTSRPNPPADPQQPGEEGLADFVAHINPLSRDAFKAEDLLKEAAEKFHVPCLGTVLTLNYSVNLNNLAETDGGCEKCHYNLEVRIIGASDGKTYKTYKQDIGGGACTGGSVVNIWSNETVTLDGPADYYISRSISPFVDSDGKTAADKFAEDEVAGHTAEWTAEFNNSYDYYTSWFVLRKSRSRVDSPVELDPLACYSTKTVSGIDLACHRDQKMSLAAFDEPTGVYVNSHREILVADKENKVIRIGSKDHMGTLAGKSCQANTQVDAQGEAARFKNPVDVVADHNHQYIYVLENVLSPSNALRRIDYLGNVKTVDLGAANISGAEAIAIDTYGHLYIASTGTHNIYKVIPGNTLNASGFVEATVTLIAGGGTSGYTNAAGTAARFNQPAGIAVDNNRNIYVADRGNHVIRKIAQQITVTPPAVAYPVTTIAGSAGNAGNNGNSDVTIANARFNQPGRLAVDPTGRIYVSDQGNHQVKKIDVGSNLVSLVAGNATVSGGYAEGKREAARLNLPSGLCFSTSVGTLYLADTYNNRIRLLEPDECGQQNMGCEATASCEEDIWYADEVDVTETNDRILNVDGIDCADLAHPPVVETGVGEIATTVSATAVPVAAGSLTWNNFAEAYERASWLPLNTDNLLALDLYTASNPTVSSIELIRDNKCKLSETGEFILLKARIKQPSCVEQCDYSLHTNNSSTAQYCSELKTGLIADLNEAQASLLAIPSTYNHAGNNYNLHNLAVQFYPLFTDLLVVLAQDAAVAQIGGNELKAADLYNAYEQARRAYELFDMAACLQQGATPQSDACTACLNEYYISVVDNMTSIADGYNALMEQWDATGSFPYSQRTAFFNIENTTDVNNNPITREIAKDEVISALGEELFNYLVTNNRYATISTNKANWETVGGSCANCTTSQYCGAFSSVPPGLGFFPTILMPALEDLNTRRSAKEFEKCAYLKGLNPSANPCSAGLVQCPDGNCACVSDPDFMEGYRRSRIHDHLGPLYTLYNPNTDAYNTDVNGVYNQTLSLSLEQLEAYLIEYAYTLECRLACELQRKTALAEFLEKKKKEADSNARQQYTTTCFLNLSENFDAAYTNKIAHYTLYEYDRAGNLIATVPPEGIDYAAAASKQHRMKTEYMLNSMYTLKEKTPDAGENIFIYDAAARIRFSQSQEQRDRSQQLGYLVFSYTSYDSEERIREVGEYRDQEKLFNGWDGNMSACNNCLLDGTMLLSLKADDATFPAKGDLSCFEKTNTIYDLVSLNVPDRAQTFLNNRVAAVYNENGITHYSYDAHGRVNFVVQQINALGSDNYKTTDYIYSPFTGKILEVVYMEGHPGEEFRHRFSYDAQERIIKAEISSDGANWENLVEYAYYLHGPVKTKIVSNNVQKIDYIYNINGWLKGINNPMKREETGRPDDIYAEAIHYFSGDYLRNGTFKTDNSPASTTRLRTFGRNLYNGNIAATVNYSAFEKTAMTTTNNLLAEAYQYDWLNRLTATRVETANQAGFTAFKPASYTNTDYAISIGYDANGNIMKLTRNSLPYAGVALGDPFNSPSVLSDPNIMDNLSYRYNYGPALPSQQLYKQNNRLNYVTDDVLTNPQQNDIRPGQALLNYGYDGKGRLTRDLSESISAIEWTAYDKVYRVSKSNNAPSLEFGYNGNQLRLYKRSFMPGNEQSTEDYVYVYGADNNLMATYTRSYNTTTGKWETRLAEQLLYGAERVGTYNRNIVTGTTTTFELPEFNPKLLNGLVRVAEEVTEQVADLTTNILADAENVAEALTGNEFVAQVDQAIKGQLIGDLQKLADRILATQPPSVTELATEVSNTITDIQNGNYEEVVERYFMQQVAASMGSVDINDGIYQRVLLNLKLKLMTPFAEAEIDQLVLGLISPMHLEDSLEALTTDGLTITEIQLKITALQDYIGTQDLSIGLIAGFFDLGGALTATIGNLQAQASNPGSLLGSLFNPDENKERYVNLISGALIAEAFIRYNDGGYSTNAQALLDQDTVDLFADSLDYSSATRPIADAILDLAGDLGDLLPILQDAAEQTGAEIEEWLEDDLDLPLNPAIPVVTEDMHLELTDHLGNVRGVVKGKLKTTGQPDVVSLSDYYPFGQIMPGRSFTSSEYRYGFNGQEKDDEISGNGNSYTAEFWQYDPRLGRRWNIDPVMAVWESPYATFRNNPIIFTDPNGDCPDCPKDAKDFDTYTDSKGQNWMSNQGAWTGTTSEMTVSGRFSGDKNTPESSPVKSPGNGTSYNPVSKMEEYGLNNIPYPGKGTVDIAHSAYQYGQDQKASNFPSPLEQAAAFTPVGAYVGILADGANRVKQDLDQALQDALPKILNGMSYNDFANQVNKRNAGKPQNDPHNIILLYSGTGGYQSGEYFNMEGNNSISPTFYARSKPRLQNGEYQDFIPKYAVWGFQNSFDGKSFRVEGVIPIE